MADYFSNALPVSGYNFGTSIPSDFAAPQYRIDDLSAAAEGLAPATSPSPSKPGVSDSPFSNAWVGGSLLLEGIGNLVRGIRGEAPRMAGSKLQEYLQTQRQESYLADLLKAIIGKSTSSGEEFRPKKRAEGPVFGSGYDPNTGLIY